jgi:signal transduction histidine kinase
MQAWALALGILRSGLGLSAMEERLASLGGRLFIESKASVGTIVIAKAPISVRTETQEGELYKPG